MSPNNNLLMFFPKITGEEYPILIPYLDRLTEQQAKDFLRMYNDNRLDYQTYMLLGVLGFFFTHGYQRFYIGHWAMGLFQTLTCGFLWVGTIYDLATGKEKVLEANMEKIRKIYSNFGNPFEVM